MSGNELAELFNTHIKVPPLWEVWKFADARNFAEAAAVSNLETNRAAYKESGIIKPAAALYVENQQYHFAVYDDAQENAADVIPEGRQLVKKINPYYLLPL